MTPRHAEPQKKIHARRGSRAVEPGPPILGGRPSASQKARFQFRQPLELLFGSLPLSAARYFGTAFHSSPSRDAHSLSARAIPLNHAALEVLKALPPRLGHRGF